MAEKTEENNEVKAKSPKAVSKETKVVSKDKKTPAKSTGNKKTTIKKTATPKEKTNKTESCKEKKIEKTEDKNLEKIKKIDEEKKPTKKTQSRKTSKSTVSKDKKKIEKAEDTKKSKKRDAKVSSIIKEQIANINEIQKIDEIEKEEEKATAEEIKQIEKKKKKRKEVDEEKIEAQIEAAKKMPKENKLLINKKVFINVIWAIIATVYLILINLGEMNVEKQIFETDLKVFSMCILAITIILFEKAYNRDSGTIAVFGIETLIIGIITLISIYTYILHQNMFINIIGTISALAIVYYIIKCVIIVINEKRKWKNKISDVKKIIAES